MSRHLLRELEHQEAQLRQDLAAVFGQGVEDWLPAEGQPFGETRILTGRVLRVTADVVWVDVGYKSEGAVALREWYDEGTGQVVPPRPGDEVRVLLEAL